MRYLGENEAECPRCEGSGYEPFTLTDEEEICARCQGLGTVDLDEPIPSFLLKKYCNTTVWSELLCDPETIQRMRAS